MKSAYKAASRYRIGIDIGGTFTDFAVVDEWERSLWREKRLTTHGDPSEGVLEGLDELTKEFRIDPADTNCVIHATTLITNAVIERKGAKTALITTRGFRDALEIAREARYDAYDLVIHRPHPIVPRWLVREIAERTASQGKELVPLDSADLKVAMTDLRSAGVESVAVCFLHSYVNSAHEIAAREVLVEQCPDVHVSLSCEVAPEIREYERASTTVVNAYVQPLTDRYLGRMGRELEQRGFQRLLMMLSDAGVTSVDTARKFPVRMIESGPAAGALIGGFFAELADQERAVAFDMGGTTAKICLTRRGQPLTAHGLEVARVHRFKKGSGLPICAPSIELVEIGAGGGSIAHIDGMGLLRVGPQSAQSYPGPACYDFGGLDATVTDADLMLGYLNADYFLGGKMKLNPQAAREAIRSRVAQPLGLDDLQAAWGIHETVCENMASAIRVHIAEKGEDAARRTLVVTGGAGPVHGYRVAQAAGLRRVICPRAAGVASAMGLLVATPKIELVRTYLARLAGTDWRKVNGIYDDMEIQATETIRQTGVTEAQVSCRRSADMRYAGQGYEIQVEVPAGNLTAADACTLTQSFHAAYTMLYGRSFEDAPVEVLNWRLVATGPKPESSTIAHFPCSDSIQETSALKGTRVAWVPEKKSLGDVAVYDRYRMRAGERFVGPAIIEEAESTMVIGAGAPFAVDAAGTIVVEVAG